MMTDPSTPFAAAVDLYTAAGWIGPVPLPAREKKSPPSGYTGADGAYATVANIDEWRTNRGTGNIGLRMAPNVIGIDVDHYDAKTGGDTFAKLLDELGPLPPTWISTSRNDGVSGIRFYRLPEAVRLIGSMPGIEIVQRHHRYAVVWPSIHPSGREYRWLNTDGEIVGIPNVDDLPTLPDAWFTYLRADSHTAAQRHAIATGDEVSPSVEKVFGRAVMGMTTGTRHDTTLQALTALIRYEHQEHPGATRAIADLERLFRSAVTADGSRGDREAESEWERMVASATEQVASTPSIIPKWEPSQPAPDAGALGLTTLDGHQPWAEPLPLPAPSPPPAFPIETLPKWCQAHALAAAEQVQVPVDLTAMLIIGGLSAAITGRAVVHASPDWTEPVNLYLVTAMRSGAGKSPAAKLTTGWLYRWQRERVEAVRAEYDRAKLKARHAHKKLAKLEGGMGDDEALFTAHAEAIAADAAIPTLPRLIADDATPEAIATLLRDHGQRLAVLSTEADLFDMLLKGKPGQRQNVNIYLKAWSGDEFIRDRKGGSETGAEWSELSNPLLTCAITVQPSVLAKVQADEEMVSRGFAARFMFSMPADLIGHRDQSKRFRSAKLTTTAPYEAEAARLASRWATWANPADLHLTADAAGALERFLVEIEPRLANGADLERLAEWTNKLHGSIVRYAGLLHLAESNDSSAPIELATVERALDLGRYWLASAVAVLALATDRVAEQAEGIMRYIAGRGVGRITLSAIQQGHRVPREGLDKVADYVPAIDLLVELGWLREPDDPDWRSGIGIRGVKSPEFTVLPSVIGQPQNVNVSRVQRIVLKGERDSLPPPSGSTDPAIPSLGAQFSELAKPPPSVVEPTRAPEPEPSSPEADTDWMDA